MDSSSSLQDSLSPDKGIFVSTYDEVCRVISEYETDTISKFIIRRVDKDFGSKGQCTILQKNHDFGLAFIFALVITRGCLSDWSHCSV